MKRIALFFIVSILIGSCTPVSQKQSTETKRVQKKIEPYLDKIFTDKYPNYKSNALIRDKALSELTYKIDSLLPYKYLEEIPLEVFRIRKNPHGKGAIVQFYADNYDYKNKSDLSNQLEFDIIGLMSEELAGSLNDKSKYFVFGKKYNRLNKTETYLIVHQSYYSPTPEISEDVIWDGVYNFKIGVFMCEVDSVKLID